MRGVTESLFRFGWALTMFGVQQAIHLATPRRGWDDATRELDGVSRAAAHEMGDTLRSYYRAGDRLQSGLVDSVARLFEGTWSEPGKRMDELWQSLDRTRARVQEALNEEDEEGS